MIRLNSMFQMLRQPMLLFSLAIVLTHCSAVQEEAPAFDPPTQQAKINDNECLPATHKFDLVHYPDTPGTYKVELETGTYIVDECMCYVTSFHVGVSASSGNNWHLKTGTDKDIFPLVLSNNVPDDLLWIAEEELEKIFESYQQGEEMELLAHWSGASPAESVVHAGGICIVDNFDATGSYGTNAQTEPIVQLVANDPPETGYRVKVWLPLSMTSPL